MLLFMCAKGLLVQLPQMLVDSLLAGYLLTAYSVVEFSLAPAMMQSKHAMDP